MTESKLPTESADSELVEVGVYSTWQDGFDHGLVALTLGDAFWLEPGASGYRLLVESGVAHKMTEQLAQFDREKINWPPQSFVDPEPARKAELAPPLIWCIAVLVSFWAQGEWREWTSFGLLDAQAVFDRGEVWRPLTALFLHDDLGHLISNLVSGVFVFAAVLTTMGRSRGGLLLMLAAVAGNFAAAAARYPGLYRSLGASTAVFAAVGMLTGRALRVVARVNHPHRWRALFVSLAAGLTVLALYGAGGQQVDVLAHLTGFAAGLMVGLVSVVDNTAGDL